MKLSNMLLALAMGISSTDARDSPVNGAGVPLFTTPPYTVPRCKAVVEDYIAAEDDDNYPNPKQIDCDDTTAIWCWSKWWKYEF